MQYISPDDKLIALATADRGVILLDGFNPREERALLTAHAHDPSFPSTLAWSPDGRFLLVGGCDGRVWCYDVASPPPPERAPDDAARPWRPGGWEPDAFVLGEDFLPPGGAAAAREAARKHRGDRLDRMLKARRDFATSLGTSVDLVPAPTRTPSVAPHLAAAAADQASRMEAPVACVRWHPRAALVASGAGAAVALWCPAVSE